MSGKNYNSEQNVAVPNQDASRPNYSQVFFWIHEILKSPQHSGPPAYIPVFAEISEVAWSFNRLSFNRLLPYDHQISIDDHAGLDYDISRISGTIVPVNNYEVSGKSRVSRPGRWEGEGNLQQLYSLHDRQTKIFR